MNLEPLDPALMKRILETSGFECVHTDQYCWLMESNGLVAVIPHTMKKLPSDTIETIVEAAQIQSTFDQLRSGFEIRPSATAS